MLLQDHDNVPSLPDLTRLLRATQNQRPLSCLDTPDAGESKLYSLGAESVTLHGQICSSVYYCPWNLYGQWSGTSL
jgi:hypothetical protein